MPRKDHTATMFFRSMIVYGGLFENGEYSNEMLNYNVDKNFWSFLTYNQEQEPFIQGVSCTVI